MTDEDRYEMQSLFDRLKYVEERQSKLKGAVDADLKRVRQCDVPLLERMNELFGWLPTVLLPCAEDGGEAEA